MLHLAGSTIQEGIIYIKLKYTEEEYSNMVRFNNKENKVYQTEDGPIWASRSVALLGVLLFKMRNNVYVLAEKRSEKMDSPGLWCVPCGYLDWNETAQGGVIREVYEETGLYIPSLNSVKLGNDESSSPFYVNTCPTENRQNVTLSYSYVFDLEFYPGRILENLIFDCEKYKNDEIDEVKLININELHNYEWAFNHQERISQAIEHQRKLQNLYILKR
jgi:8-oxo-dGTP pyrophosphatase MutT (NUDIX family)